MVSYFLLSLLLSTTGGTSLVSSLPAPDSTATGTQSSASAHSASATPSESLLSSLPATSSYSASLTPPSSSSPPSKPVKVYLAGDKSLPEKQEHCSVQVFCPGKDWGGAILQTVQLSGLWTDSKTFVDKPPKIPNSDIISSYKNLTKPVADGNGNVTIKQLEDWIGENFAGEGTDLRGVDIPDFNPTPAYLNKIADDWVRPWAQTVNSYWRKLAREDVKETREGVESTMIPLNRSFIIAGGRFRESYYWDSRWILEGLLIGEIHSMAKNMIENFLDQLEIIGYIPNGARKYYLNRSQPPLFPQMVDLYLEYTNDTSILERALPLLEKEMKWWDTNRTTSVSVGTSKGKKTYPMKVYRTVNTAPRPEGYIPDYTVVNGPAPFTPATSPNISQKKADQLYADLAAGAESGQDYSAGRWTREPMLDRSDNSPGLRTLELNQIIPVDLNSILVQNYALISKFYSLPGKTQDKKKAASWDSRSKKLEEAILAVHWDSSRLAFYDYNLTSKGFANYWSAAGFYPYWSNIWPQTLLESEEKMQKAFAPIGYLFTKYNGSLPTTILDSGFQWDLDAWPPHNFIYGAAIRNIPTKLAKSSFSKFTPSLSKFSSLPQKVFGSSITDEKELAQQPINGVSDKNITEPQEWSSLVNVGTNQNATKQDDGEMSWKDGLELAVAQRYVSSAFCSWLASGGSIPGVVSQLPPDQLNATGSKGGTGNMFEKFSVTSLNAAGVGGEYTVQDGFGWTNGVLAYFVDRLGDKLQRPECPPIAVPK